MITPDRQIRQRSSAWARLEALLDQAHQSIVQLPAEELRELGELYRQVCTERLHAATSLIIHRLCISTSSLPAPTVLSIATVSTSQTGFLRSFARPYRARFAQLG